LTRLWVTFRLQFQTSKTSGNKFYDSSLEDLSTSATLSPAMCS
jgi:hypothetical protein